MNKLKAAIFYYVLRPVMNRCGWLTARGIIACPMCGELLEHYDSHGLLHLADGDADCYGALSAGKGSFS